MSKAMMSGYANPNSLPIVMGLIVLGSWFAHSVIGWSADDSDEIEHRGHHERVA